VQQCFWVRFCERGFCGKRESCRFAALNGNFQFTLTLYDKLWFWPRHNSNGHIKSTTWKAKTIDVSFMAALMPRLSDALVAPFLSAFSFLLSPLSIHPFTHPPIQNPCSAFDANFQKCCQQFLASTIFCFPAALCFVRPSSAASST